MTARGAHLVGSVPLANAEAVFTTLASELGDRLRRIPDGETGPRSDWIVWQLPVFTSQPRLEVVPPAPDGWRPLPRVRLEDGARAEDVRFAALGYADAAIASGNPVLIVSWISQTFLQLVLLSIIIVGQNVLAAASDKRSEATYEDADAVLHTALQIQDHLLAQDLELEKLVASLPPAKAQ